MGEPVFQPLRFDSSVFSADRQFAAFASGLANFAMSRRQDGPFDARAQIWRVGAVVLTHSIVDAARYDRTSPHLLANGADHIVTSFAYKGGLRGDFGRGVVGARKGSVSVVDMAQPFWAENARRELMSVAIPRESLLSRLEGWDPHGLVAYGDLAPLLGVTLRGIAGSLQATPLAFAPAIERIICDLVVGTLLGALRSAARPEAADATLLARLHAYIDEHLCHGLDVPTICAALGVSRSSLYRAVGGGIQNHVLLRRLRRARLLLGHAPESRSINAIAESVGFQDSSHFNRSFKRHYGITPGALRAGADLPAEKACASDETASETYRGWTRQLS